MGKGASLVTPFRLWGTPAGFPKPLFRMWGTVARFPTPLRLFPHPNPSPMGRDFVPSPPSPLPEGRGGCASLRSGCGAPPAGFPTPLRLLPTPTPPRWGVALYPLPQPLSLKEEGGRASLRSAPGDCVADFCWGKPLRGFPQTSFRASPLHNPSPVGRGLPSPPSPLPEGRGGVMPRFARLWGTPAGFPTPLQLRATSSPSFER